MTMLRKWFAFNLVLCCLSGVLFTGCGTDTTTEINVTDQEPPPDDPASNAEAPAE
jgi:hypothetical protein